MNSAIDQTKKKTQSQKMQPQPLHKRTLTR